MTEEEWADASNPSRLIDIVRVNASRVPLRKLRLYISACCRRLPPSMLEGQLGHALEAVEHFADGQITLEDVNRVRKRLADDFRGDFRHANRDWFRHILAANNLLWDATRAIGNKVDIVRYRLTPESPMWAELAASGCPIGPCERWQLGELLRDIFGNPFRPVGFSPEWRTDTAVALARTMYESRDFSAMAILADALQDAGCDSDDILSHCRGVAGRSSEEPAWSSSAQATHVRGCWVVDLVLGKE